VTEERWRRRADVLWRRSLDGVLLLPSGAEEPLTLAGTGPEMWELLAEPISMPDLTRELATRYETDAATVEADLAPVLDHLVAIQAIERVP
jgi:Coenzyme PQQ synthesis protein D (PqqD)